ncbi:chain length determinant protein tyrosine kinase EpsG [Methylocaldum szegediense]|uniref:Chain length determinant protein tyrosine kinase EpsG n=1 Tax=Methylocaldum szegediense TaxID=73780 RepID=A0ABM9HW64_9GAMM|nr:chain length determinant protein tyrosine kinase EpsG [Methylocaldum szegediense]CAI8724888.1 Chain length determinant protein tyrosine kinase EpsG [Methylocaldum szegediense]
MTQAQPIRIKPEFVNTDRRIGHILRESGRLSALDAERVLHLQRETGLRFGEAALQLGLISEEDIRRAISEQFDYRYLKPGQGNFSAKLIAAYQPFSAQMEVFRAIRSQLMLRWHSEGNKILAVTSPGRGEGRSYAASNLAVVFSQLGQRTLLIDADLRRPCQHEIFALGRTGLGLSDLLVGRGGAECIRRIEEFADLSVLPAGTLPPNPSELLSRGTFDVLLRDLVSAYDIILLDTPAGVASSDAQTVAARAGACLLIARKHVTRFSDADFFRQMLTAVGCRIVGAVLNEF